MKTEPKDRFSGISLSEWVERMPNELSIDAVGMWQIVPFGRKGFGLEGEELVAFTRRCVDALLQRGAKPVVGAVDGIHYWELKGNYGDTNDKVTEAVISEWLASGQDPDAGGLWFALPKIYQAKKT
jgi:hypothetical protein